MNASRETGKGEFEKGGPEKDDPEKDDHGKSNPEALRGRIVPRLVIGAFTVYRRLLSPVLHAISGSAGACRFQPTCSEYAAVALETHGVVRGTLLALGRLARCHPFHPAAFDPVPAKKSTAPNETHSGRLKHTSLPPVTIDQAGFSSIPSAASQPRAAAPPQVR